MLTPPTIETANLGMADSLILMVMALVVFGPRRLPQIGRQIGKLMYEFRKASNDFKYQMEEELRSAEEADRRKKEEERLRTLALAPPAEPAPAEPPMTIESLVAAAEAAKPPESPYPGEGAYPELAAPAAETRPEETRLRIQPPSTGEPVPAAPPNGQFTQTESEDEVKLAKEESVPVQSFGEGAPGLSLGTESEESPGASQAAEKLNTEGGGGFNPRIKPTESTRALAPESPFSPASANNSSSSAASLAPEAAATGNSPSNRAKIADPEPNLPLPSPPDTPATDQPAPSPEQVAHNG